MPRMAQTEFGLKYDGPALADESLDELRILDRNALRQLLGRRAIAPERFRERLPQIDERLTQQRRALVRRLFRKRIGEVSRGELAVPAQHVERDEIGETPEAVEHRQRQAREKLEGMTHTNAPAWKRAQGERGV